jgi:virginiamycin A acetyltransferase
MLEVGAGTYGHQFINITFDDGTVNLKIGNFCAIAQEVRAFNSAEHPMQSITTYPFGRPAETKGLITVGNDVWLGWGVVLMSGITIGDGCIIGAYSVVASDIPPYYVAVGNPCRPVKQRFSDDEIALLLKMKWWLWPNHKIVEAFERGLLTKDKDVKKLHEYYLENVLEKEKLE